MTCHRGIINRLLPWFGLGEWTSCQARQPTARCLGLHRSSPWNIHPYQGNNCKIFSIKRTTESMIIVHIFQNGFVMYMLMYFSKQYTHYKVKGRLHGKGQYIWLSVSHKDHFLLRKCYKCLFKTFAFAECMSDIDGKTGTLHARKPQRHMGRLGKVL